MTLRCTIEIVPHGDEDRKFTILALNASLIKEYALGYWDYMVEVETDGHRYPETWAFTINHQRVDGAGVLVSKILSYMEETINENN